MLLRQSLQRVGRNYAWKRFSSVESIRRTRFGRLIKVSLDDLKVNIENKDVDKFSINFRDWTKITDKRSDVLDCISDDFIGSLNFKISYIMNNLADCGLDCSKSQHRDIAKKMINQFNSLDDINAQQIVTFLTGLSRCNCRLVEFSNAVSFVTNVISVIPHMNAREITQMLIAFNKLHVNRLPEQFYEDIIDNVKYCHKEIDNVYIPSFLFALSRMEFKLNKVRDHQFCFIIYNLMEHALNARLANPNISGADSYDMATILMASANMSIFCGAIPHSLRLTIFDVVREKLVFMEASSACGFIGAMSRMNFKWELLSHDLQKSILQTLVNIHNQLDVVLAHNALVSIVMMWVPFQSLNNEEKQMVYSLIKRVFPVAISTHSHTKPSKGSCWADVIQILHDLDNMNIRWSLLPQDVKDAIFQGVKAQSPLSVELMNFALKGFSLLGASWTDLEPNLQKSLLNDMKNEDFLLDKSEYATRLLNSLAKMQIGWSSLPRDSLEMGIRQCRSFHPTNISLTIYSLAILEASWCLLEQQTRLALLNRLKRSHTIMADMDVANIAYGLALLTFDYAPNSLQDEQQINELHKITVDLLVQKFSTKIDEKFMSQLALYYTMLSTKPQYSSLLQLLEKSIVITSKKTIVYAKFKNCVTMVDSILQELNSKDIHYSVKSCEGLLKIDAFNTNLSIYRQSKGQNELIGLISISADPNYETTRENELKRECYWRHYPNIPLYHVDLSSKDVLNSLKSKIYLIVSDVD